MRRSRALFVSAMLPLCSGCDSEPEGTIVIGPAEPPPILRDETPPTIADVRPPPLSGGTLLVTADGSTAVVSDPDRDRIVLVTLPAGPVREVALQPGDEPGRAAEDAEGNVHVALRRGGAIATLDVEAAAISERRSVCSAPRGVAYDASRRVLHVACASGELVRLDPGVGGAVLASQHIEVDLRDVVVSGSQLLVSVFRGSTVLVVDDAGAIVGRHRPSAVAIDAADGRVEHAPSTAWRMASAGANGAVMSYNVARTTPIELGDTAGEPAYTSHDCAPPVRSELAFVSADGVAPPFRETTIALAALPVDIAVSADGARIAVLDAGTGTVQELAVAALQPSAPCLETATAWAGNAFADDAVATAYAGDTLLVQGREPSRLYVTQGGTTLVTVELGGQSRADTGYQLFHQTAGAFSFSPLACASCHPEGREDGHVWAFSDVGARRTQSLAGTLQGTAPFHWGGDLETLDVLLDEVMVRRMGGLGQTPERADALRTWLEAVPPTRAGAAAPLDAVERGRALFTDAETGCAFCHVGGTTDNRNHFVGTRAVVQTPSLVGVGMRAPYMHDGCAATLRDRFDPSCGGGDLHGKTSHLTAEQIDDLVAYMTTL